MNADATRPSVSSSTASSGGAVEASGTAVDARLVARQAHLAYDRRTVSEAVDAEVREGSFTVIVGPNACGKSTLLRAFARLLKPRSGSVLLDGRELATVPAKEAARTVGLLPQTSTAPDGITVAELVARGRYPHQGLFRQWTGADREAVDAALAETDLADLVDVPVDELSGGQRQRVWVAMALAQQTPVLLLDEPTTYLDIAHQYDLLDLFARLHAQGTTVVAVLHDLNQAARYATDLIVMSDGDVVATGAPADVLTEQLVTDVFDLPCLVVPDPVTGSPLVVPRRRAS
ncbi:ABC transporter ATP-binding protein [Frigoribacterium faeni]|uniref:ABC transporter n=1 Tax=Frigoribacterium faeni TaxID=145483 RepID=A0A7W3JFM0_9MICO|nr:ABC transporter ATP-binding protein [Frigoribacterium faeni]MBA8811921.1 iron complex transport system ATP-binding protein [Frigoribacterium faeni]BFF12908.1 ABC transporter ATP-binding protein [Microbacterium flavescens]GEK83771.1 ABC transporter [Frigoribacterium faeni]